MSSTMDVYKTDFNYIISHFEELKNYAAKHHFNCPNLKVLNEYSIYTTTIFKFQKMRDVITFCLDDCNMYIDDLKIVGFVEYYNDVCNITPVFKYEFDNNIVDMISKYPRTNMFICSDNRGKISLKLPNDIHFDNDYIKYLLRLILFCKFVHGFKVYIKNT